MKSLINIIICLSILIGVYSPIHGQVTTTFPYTGSSQTWTVPPCVTSITVVVAGADGGGNLGGNGAVVTATIPVNPGDVITIVAGGSGSLGAGGFGGGGNGWVTTIGGQTSSGGGGGASSVMVNGVPVVVAGGGGGGNGGSSSNLVSGGAGGCGSGVAGGGSVFTNTGGFAGTQTAGGNGGAPWGAGQPGQAGSLGQGGNGGHNQAHGASGGGGGGGYYGGGGGGGDNCCIGANGGGGGGGGSSLVPAGAGCVQGSNNGAGYVSITSTPGITASNTGPYCEGSTIQLSATAGATTYSWTGPNGFTSSLQNPTIPNATVAMSGTYSVTGTGTGCNTPATTTVVVQAPPTPNAGPDSVICLGDLINLDGTFTAAANTYGWTHDITGITPVPTVTYAPNASNIDPTVTVNQAGTYIFTLTEDDGLCPPQTDDVSILVSITDHTTSWVGPSCAGMSDGSITITNPDAVEYSFDNATTWVTNSTMGGFPVGTYTVWSRNQYGCEFSSVVNILEPAQLYVYAGNDTLVCQNGTANLWANTSAPGIPMIYHWSHPTSGTTNTETFDPIVNTTIEVYAEGPNGCLSDTAEVLVSVRPPIAGYISPFDTICPGYPTTIGVFGLSDGIGAPFDIVWSTGDVGSGDFMDIGVNPPVTTTYTATITDACESTPLVLTTEVYVAPVPEPIMSVVDDHICEPAIFELINETDPAMVGSYVWNISDGQSAANESPYFTEEFPFGSYDVQLIVTSPLGCIDSITNYSFITSDRLPVADFNWSPNPVQMFNTDVNFQNKTFLGNDYYWTFEDGIPSYSNLKNPQVQFPNGVVGQYDVTLFVVSEYGCMDTITKVVIVNPEVLIYAPNTFTPDGDEFNQYWRVFLEGVDVQSFDLQIYNRWGEIVWESHDIEIGWDGTYNGKVVKEGTYIWKVSVRDALNDGKYSWNGLVNVLK